MFGVLALMTGAAARGSPRARATRTSPPRRALRQIALERDAEAYDFYELAPGASGSAPTYWLLRDALEEIPAEAARASEVRAATFADAARAGSSALGRSRARRPFRSPRRGEGPLGPRHFPRRRLSFRSSRERRKKRASSVPSPHTRARSRRPPRAANHGPWVLPHASASFRARERLALALGSPRRLARPERLRESDGRRRGAPRPAAGAPLLAGRVAIVTGANSGIGLETARALALGGARVVLACRDPTAAARAAEDVRAENPCALVTVLPPFPSTSRRSPPSAPADAFLALELPLHILVHNAGVMPCPFQLTADGHELAFQVNYLSRDSSPRLLPRLRRVVRKRRERRPRLPPRRPRRLRRAQVRLPARRAFEPSLRTRRECRIRSTPIVRPIKTRRDVGRDGFQRRFAAVAPRGTRQCSSSPRTPARFERAGANARVSECGGWRGWVLHRLGNLFEDCRRGHGDRGHAATGDEKDRDAPPGNISPTVTPRARRPRPRTPRSRCVCARRRTRWVRTRRRW